MMKERRSMASGRGTGTVPGREADSVSAASFRLSSAASGGGVTAGMKTAPLTAIPVPVAGGMLQDSGDSDSTCDGDFAGVDTADMTSDMLIDRADAADLSDNTDVSDSSDQSDSSDPNDPPADTPSDSFGWE